MAFLDMLNAAAKVVGGTQPDPTGNPYWFSGRDVGDSSGVAGLSGCWSLPPSVLGATPIAMVLPGPWRPADVTYPTQGHKFEEQELHVRVMVGHDDEQAQLALLVPFRDLVPPAFDSHMMLFNTAGVTSAWCSEGDFLEVSWPAGTTYFALIFVVRCQRAITVTYTG